jgi:hypothetical protein
LNKKRKRISLPFFGLDLLVDTQSFTAFKQDRDAPKSTKSNQSKNDSGNHMGSTRENPGNNIKIEETDASPVQAANDQNDKSNSVKHFSNTSDLSFEIRI